MDLTSSFTALLPGDKRDTEMMKHTNTQAKDPWEAHTYSLAALVLQHIHMTLMFVFKIQLPTYWYFTGIFKMQTRAMISQGSHWFLFMSQPRGPTPPRLPLLLIQCIFAWLTHTGTHTHTPKQTHLYLPTPAPAHACSRGVLINRQSVKNHSLKSLKGFTPALWLAGKENPMNS